MLEIRKNGDRTRRIILFLAGTAILIGAPLLGAVARGRSLLLYLEFPPRTRFVQHPSFSWLIFCNMAATVAVLCALLYWRRLWLRSRTVPTASEPPVNKNVSAHRGRFPWWAWAGAVLLTVSWYAAWDRPEWLGPAVRYTFTPLWFGFILVLDGLVYRRRGHSMLTRAPAGFAALFAVSAITWWFFEYLNRFTQNWYYSAVNSYGPLGYVLSATPAFSTVLPAVFEISELLATFDWVQRYRQVRAFTVRLPGARPLSLIIGIAALAAAAAFPAIFFPALWLAPLFVVVPLLSWAGRQTPFSRMQSGDWRCVIALSLAALICGFFWEMWNCCSWPKWFYAIPYVQRFHLFEMPSLGYAGYLPFGIECYCAYQFARLVLPGRLFDTLRAADGLCR